MKLPGQTQLDQLADLPPELRARLKAMWIEGVEEYLALLAAADPAVVEQTLGKMPGGVESARRSAAALLGAPAMTFSGPQAGGSLGCKIDPQLLAQVQAEGELRPRRTRPVTAPRGTLPKAVRLMDRIGPPKNQGQRGTCVAFSSVALRECIAGSGTFLSEQFLYWACKELDGLDDAGTFIHTAMTALSTFGVCPAEDWPYVPEQILGNESQGPAAGSAVQAALQFRMDNTRTVEPSYIDQYKHVLAGGEGSPGMPIAFAVLVFNSWYCSSETHRTGKITMPLPGERPLPGGHAMCVVGYVDDDDVPGGGYFIVRNSWGSQWAERSPEAPGHALMPYAYAERFAVEAFTGPAGQVSDPAPEKSDDPLARYRRRLATAARDMEGKLLPAGTAVLAHPAAPGELMEETGDLRRTFERQGFGWSPAVRAAALLPAPDTFPAEFKTHLDQAAAARQQFMNALDANLKSSEETIFPEANLPTLCNFLLWDPRVKRVDQIVDMSPELGQSVRQAAGVPGDLQDPEGWARLWHDAAAARIYSLHGSGGAYAHVVAAFVTPLAVSPQSPPEFRAPGAGTLDSLFSAYRAWLAAHPEEKPQFTFYSVGSLLPWPEELQPTASGHSWTLIVSPPSVPVSEIAPGGGGWPVKTPPRFADALSLRNFTDRLKPETRGQRIARIKALVDDLLTDYQGNVDIDLIARKTGDRRTNIQEAFFELQAQGHYQVYKTPDHRTAVRKKTGGGGGGSPRVRRPSERRGEFSHYVAAAVLLILSVLALWLKDVIFTSHRFASILFLIPIMYVSRLVDRKLNHLIESREKE